VHNIEHVGMLWTCIGLIDCAVQNIVDLRHNLSYKTTNPLSNQSKWRLGLSVALSGQWVARVSTITQLHSFMPSLLTPLIALPELAVVLRWHNSPSLAGIGGR